MTEPFTIHPRGLRLAVRVTVRARRSEITGVVAGADGRPALGVRLAAPPVDGAANKALRRLVAGALGMPASDVSIVSGETSRAKLLELSGNGEQITGKLRAILADPSLR